jgi:hypothetical protein
MIGKQSISTGTKKKGGGSSIASETSKGSFVAQENDKGSVVAS